MTRFPRASLASLSETNRRHHHSGREVNTSSLRTVWRNALPSSPRPPIRAGVRKVNLTQPLLPAPRQSPSRTQITTHYLLGHRGEDNRFIASSHISSIAPLFARRLWWCPAGPSLSKQPLAQHLMMLSAMFIRTPFYSLHWRIIGRHF